MVTYVMSFNVLCVVSESHPLGWFFVHLFRLQLSSLFPYKKEVEVVVGVVAVVEIVEAFEVVGVVAAVML